MAFGTLYVHAFANPRSTAILAVAKANDIALETIQVPPSTHADARHRDLNPQAKVPTFVAPDGFVLTECIAIALYLASQNEQTTLLGDSKREYASVVRWMSFANFEILPHLRDWFFPIVGLRPFNKKEVEHSRERMLYSLEIMEKHLAKNSYLAGTQLLSLADLFAAGVVAGAFQFFLDGAWRKQHPNMTKWYTGVCELPIYKEVAGDLVLAEQEMPIVSPTSKDEQKQTTSSGESNQDSSGKQGAEEA